MNALKVPEKLLPLAWFAGIQVAVVLLFFAVQYSNELSRHKEIESAVAALKAERYDEMRRVIEPLAVEGDSEARKLMGQMFAFGWGVPKDSSVAEDWFRRSECECDDPGRHAYYTALDYLHGHGATRDTGLAGEWLVRAAAAGNPEAKSLIRNPKIAAEKGFDVPRYE